MHFVSRYNSGIIHIHEKVFMLIYFHKAIIIWLLKILFIIFTSNDVLYSFAGIYSHDMNPKIYYFYYQKFIILTLRGRATGLLILSDKGTIIHLIQQV